MVIKDIPEPSVAELNKAIERWNSGKDAKIESKLNSLFTETYLLNDTVEKVETKINELNKFYHALRGENCSTEEIHKIAEGIVSLKIDERLKTLDFNLVNEIADINFDHNFSFASKYCAFHNPKDYAMYDRHAASVLYYFTKMKDSTMFTDARIEAYAAVLKSDYKVYYETLCEFITRFSLQDFSLRDLDHYLWYTGAELLKK